MDSRNRPIDHNRHGRGLLIHFDFVPLHTVGHEIAPNIARHYSEMTEGDEYGIPNIDWDSYISLSHAGQCMVVTVRDDEKLIGYSVYSIGRNPRYKHFIDALSDGVFLEKEYRGKLSGEFMKKADEYLRNIGIHETSYILSDDRIGHILGRSGYQSHYKIWSKKYGQ